MTMKNERGQGERKRRRGGKKGGASCTTPKTEVNNTQTKLLLPFSIFILIFPWRDLTGFLEFKVHPLSTKTSNYLGIPLFLLFGVVN
jgi:hypothetical protein